MKILQIILILITTFVSGCLESTLNLPPDKSKLEKIEAGTLASSVRIIAGEPAKIVKSEKGFTTYYYKEKISSDCEKDLQTCVPIVFENGKVTAVGHQWAKAWIKQHEKKPAAATVKTTPPKAGPKVDPKANREEIAKLEKQVRAIPMSRTMDNLNIYRYLLKLDPDNPRYQKKVVFYERRFEKERAKRVTERKQLAVARKWQNQRLKEFKGDTPIQMAVKIMGNGKFYVWLKNTGEKPFRVEARHFFLSCKKNKRYGIYSSKDFGKDLEPGAVIEGRITFAVYCDPRKIVYANPDVATLTREIPAPELQADVPPPPVSSPRDGKKREPRDNQTAPTAPINSSASESILLPNSSVPENLKTK